MSGQGKALERLWAHETRRSHRRPVPLDERRWIDADPVRAVRALNQVDRAADAGRRAREAA